MLSALEERYLTWLYSQVAEVNPRPRVRTFHLMFEQFYNTIFVSHIAHDENRIKDAQELRYEFLAHCEDEVGDPHWTRGNTCNMLELFVVLSRQLAFEMDDPVKSWFWHLVEMLDLEQYNDRNYDEDAEEVIEETLSRVIHRTYGPDGRGGLFPLRNPIKDQRKVELWYQLNAYLLEQF